MIFIGIDPSSAFVGLAIAQILGDGGIAIQRLKGVRCFAGDPIRSVRERVLPEIRMGVCGVPDVPLIAEALQGVLAAFVEKAPAKARGDTNHGPQASIGDAIGFVGGLSVAELLVGGVTIERVEPSPWRNSMLIWAARNGLVRVAPKRSHRRELVPEDVGRSAIRGRLTRGMNSRGVDCYWLRYHGCEHVQDVPVADGTVGLNRSRTCMACRVPVMDDAQWVRDQWKALACEIVCHFWPLEYAELVVDAKSRARTERPDHQIAGVADACEAMGVLLHAVLEHESSASSLSSKPSAL